VTVDGPSVGSMAVGEVLRGTPPGVGRGPVDPVTDVLPPSLAERVKAFDEAVDGRFELLRGRPWADRLFYGASALGDFSLVWHLLGTARALRGPRHEKEAVRLAVSLGVESALVNGVVKSFFRRERPIWDQHRPRRLRKPTSSSFPSGHATSGFMAASLLGQGEPVPVRALWFGTAALVAASRVHVKIHHPSDVVAGAAIGLGLGALVRRIWPIGNARR
jgi:undecaprenyl-diphosphatase